jgi:hypothetical protein
MLQRLDSTESSCLASDHAQEGKLFSPSDDGPDYRIPSQAKFTVSCGYLVSMMMG